MARRSLADLRDEMRAVARGERKPTPIAATTLHSVLTDEALELLIVLAKTPSTTVSGLAQRFGKAQSNVSRTLQRLAAYGIVRLVRDGPKVRPEMVSSNGHSDHRRLDARSQVMHCLIAKKLLENPALVDQARSTIARWTAQAIEPLPSYLLEWGRILETSPQEIAAFLVRMHEDSVRLRQSSPFTGCLTPDERSRVYEAFR